MSILNSGVNEKMIKTDKVVYRTRTQEEYDWLMEKLEKAGCEWGSGSLPTEINYWVRNFAETCICLNDKRMMHSGFAFFKAESDYKDYEFIKVSDLMENEEKFEIIDKLETMNEQLKDELKKLKEENDESQKIKKVVYTTEVYFE